MRQPLALLLVLLLGSTPAPAGSDFAAGDDEFDWERDRVVLRGGKERRGVVIEACDPERVVLLLDGGRREEFPLEDVERVDKLRDRLASLLEKHRAGLAAETEWQLAVDAQRAGLPHMARLLAYRVLTLEPEHAQAHEFLGHERAGKGYDWKLGKKSVSPKKFAELSQDWNDRLVLESEHFVVETDAGLARGLAVLFDLEGLYVWWLEYLGPELHATEDVDDPRTEKMTFLVHRSLASFQPLSQQEPLYDPFGQETTEKGGINVARTYYLPDSPRPERLFELGTESLIYSTLVLGKARGTDSDTRKIERSAMWAETGLAYWVARHCGGAPGFPEIRAPFEEDFELDFDTALRTLEPVTGAHPLSGARFELTNLIGLRYDDFVGKDPDIPATRARCASFISFLIEADPPVRKGRKEVGRGRAGLWHYFREVYGTPRAHASDAFDEGLGAKVETLEEAWKAWSQQFTSVVGK